MLASAYKREVESWRRGNRRVFTETCQKRFPVDKSFRAANGIKEGSLIDQIEHNPAKVLFFGESYLGVLRQFPDRPDTRPGAGGEGSAGMRLHDDHV